MEINAAWNADYIDIQYKLWKSDPNNVSKDWQIFFQGFEIAASGKISGLAPEDNRDQAMRQSRVQALIYRYRDVGHLMACLDPLAACPTDHPLLNLNAFHLTPDDLDQHFYARGFSDSGPVPLRDILAALKETYCRSIGVEFMHIQDPSERRWLEDRMEPVRNHPPVEADVQQRILEKLLEAGLFEQFLNKKYLAVTRFSLEGAEAIIPALDHLVDHLARRDCREIILGMAHRGRLNVQTNILQKTYEDIFSEFENCYNEDDLVGAGDVKYHRGYLTDIKTARGESLRIFLMDNPSHLESVDPVVEGFVHARQEILNDHQHRQVTALLIHGDSAFAGQGIVSETLNMSQLEGYKTGGTLHLVINNQIGYTTLPEHARSTRYCTDLAKMLMVPIFHVHGEDPEALVHVFRLAADYRFEFGKDVVIDIICYRKYGHNEGDEPYFTQPQMYERIKQRPCVHQIYAEKLMHAGIVNSTDIENLTRQINRRLEEAYETIHGSDCLFPMLKYYENWEDYHSTYSFSTVDTGVNPETLRALAEKLNRVPQGFSLNPKLQRLLKKRQQSIERAEGIDWATAESLAFASLLTEGAPIRLSGQDSGRGTFSQRHSVLFDMQTEARFIPLTALDPKQAPFCVYDSLLSEAGVLGFEYGYSIAQPAGLVLWEAQFGDFSNNAQAIIDLFIVSGESKWQRLSGLVLLLPHGYEGLGPEHSSARPERFLQLCAGENIQVCNPSTPSQYFHLLRRQAKSTYRKPLVILTPKSLLRHPLAVSTLESLTNDHFQPVLDESSKVNTPEKILFCNGKIYYELLIQKNEFKIDNIAIVRLEQLYPFPENQLDPLVRKYEGAGQWCWVQEEPENMGAWQFVKPRLEKLVGTDISYIGRAAAPSPATGFPTIHKQEQSDIVSEAVGHAPGNGRSVAVS